jgi:dihydroorotate dehydrogenase electron transfer subunit
MLCKVLENIEVAPKIFRLTAENEKIARESVPGQFLHIRISEYFPLLRRPMSVHDVREKYFSILYKIRGEGTRILSDYSPGEKIDVIGPLGRGFFVKDTNHISIIAGGMGIAPLFFLARIKRPVTIFIGAKTRDEIPLLDKLSGLGEVILQPRTGV